MVGPSPARGGSARWSARARRAQALAASAAAPAANDGGSRRARAAGRGGHPIQPSSPGARAVARRARRRGTPRAPDPAALQVAAAVAGAPLELVAEQVPQVLEDARLDRRVQPVAAVVDPDPV